MLENLTPPDEEVIKVNCDGTYDLITKDASTGVVIRNYEGKFVDDYNRKDLRLIVLLLQKLLLL